MSRKQKDIKGVETELTVVKPGLCVEAHLRAVEVEKIPELYPFRKRNAQGVICSKRDGVNLYPVRTLYAEQNADGTYSILNDFRVIAADITGFDASHVYLTVIENMAPDVRCCLLEYLRSVEITSALYTAIDLAEFVRAGMADGISSLEVPEDQEDAFELEKLLGPFGHDDDHVDDETNAKSGGGVGRRRDIH